MGPRHRGGPCRQPAAGAGVEGSSALGAPALSRWCVALKHIPKSFDVPLFKRWSLVLPLEMGRTQ